MVDILCVSQITTVCNFFTYIRYIQQGLVKQQDGELRSDWMYGSTCVASCDRGVCGVACLVEQMFWEVMQLRREMSLAKLGYYKDQLWQTGVPAVRPRPSLFLAPPLPTWVCSAWENLAGTQRWFKNCDVIVSWDKVWIIQTLTFLKTNSVKCWR